jgi:hypothetical protein
MNCYDAANKFKSMVYHEEKKKSKYIRSVLESIPGLGEDRFLTSEQTYYLLRYGTCVSDPKLGCTGYVWIDRDIDPALPTIE